MEENDDDHHPRFLEALLVRCRTASLKNQKMHYQVIVHGVIRFFYPIPTTVYM